MPAILWMDGRASLEAEEIENTEDPVLKYGGGHESVEWMLPRILWLNRNRPQIYHQAERIVEALDWFTFRLTDQWNLSINQVTDLWHYVPLLGGWPISLLRRIGLENSIPKWPDRISAIGDWVGDLTAQAAGQLGLKPGIPVACGGVDAHVGVLGLNAINPGQMGLIVGSSTVQVALPETPVFHPEFWGPFQDSTPSRHLAARMRSGINGLHHSLVYSKYGAGKGTQSCPQPTHVPLRLSGPIG